MLTDSFHGGGWTLGDLEGEDTTCRRVCVSAGIMVVSVDYRLCVRLFTSIF